MNQRKKRSAQIISILLAVILIQNSCLFFSMKADAATEVEIYKDDNCKITFKIRSEWESGMEGQFILETMGNEAWEGWKFQVTFPHEITNLWDGEIKSHQDIAM